MPAPRHESDRGHRADRARYADVWPNWPRTRSRRRHSARTGLTRTQHRPDATFDTGTPNGILPLDGRLA